MPDTKNTASKEPSVQQYQLRIIISLDQGALPYPVKSHHHIAEPRHIIFARFASQRSHRGKDHTLPCRERANTPRKPSPVPVFLIAHTHITGLCRQTSPNLTSQEPAVNLTTGHHHVKPAVEKSTHAITKIQCTFICTCTITTSMFVVRTKSPCLASLATISNSNSSLHASSTPSYHLTSHLSFVVITTHKLTK